MSGIKLYAEGNAGTHVGGERVVVVSIDWAREELQLCFDDNDVENWPMHAATTMIVWDDDVAEVTAVTPPPLPKKSERFRELAGSTRLPTDSAARKELPVYSGVLKYFPLAIASVSAVSKKGGDKHTPGQPLHWARGLSMDQLDCCQRHLIDVAILDYKGEDATEELAQVAWRALAELQLRLEKKGGL